MSNIQWSSLFDLGGIVALIGFPYLIWNSRTKRKHFDFDFEGSSGLTSNNELNYTWTFEGVIKNRSEVPNSISKIFLIVWKNQKRNSCLRLGHDKMTIEEVNHKEKLNLPIYFGPREAKKVIIKKSAIIQQNDADYKILSQTTKPNPESKFTFPKYNYELAFEDIDKNYFDQRGVIRDIDEANLWFTLGNSYRKLDDAIFFPIIKHFGKIIFQKIKFSVRRVFWLIGLY